MSNIVEIYADGACKGNPGPGGWGAWLLCEGKEKTLSGGEPLTTNNRMELTAVIRALEALKKPCEVKVYTDSSYVQKGISEWIIDSDRFDCDDKISSAVRIRDPENIGCKAKIDCADYAD